MKRKGKNINMILGIFLGSILLICVLSIGIFPLGIQTVSASYLAESYHPYANNYENIWTISEPGVAEMRIHFTKIELLEDDYVRILDIDKNVLARYGYSCDPLSEADMWTEWFTGDTLKIKLETDGSGTAFGFILDEVERRIESAPTSSYLAESYHFYANNYENIWTISEPGVAEMRIHFTKIELLEDDYVRILDIDKNVLARYGYSCDPLSEADMWTEWFTGDTLKIKLETDGSGTAFGFILDEVERRIESAPTSSYLAESYHFYANNYENTWTISEPGAAEIRIHFTKIELLEDDYVRILDIDKNVLARYGYSCDPLSEADMWTEWFTGDTLKIKLETDGSGTAFGFIVDKKEARGAVPPLESTSSLAESYHPYANNYENTWTISEPGVAEMRIHFTKIELLEDDYVRILDIDKNVLATYGYSCDPLSEADMWTEWFTGDTLKIKLETDGSGTAFGFILDEVERRTESAPTSSYLAESYHPYANNYENIWTISEPGVAEMRIHFTKIELLEDDYVRILDIDKNVLARYGYSCDPLSEADMWTEWFTGDTLKIKLETDGSGTAFGFIVDKKEARGAVPPLESTSSLAESYHPYANNYENTWTISESGVAEMRIHFTKIELLEDDYVRILDIDKNVLARYGYSCDPLSEADMWTEWFTGDTLKIKLETDGIGTAFGFIVDKKEARGAVPTPEPSPSQTLTPSPSAQQTPTPVASPSTYEYPTPTPTPPTHITIKVTPAMLNISESVTVSGEIVPASSTIVTMIFKSPTGEIAEQPVMTTLSGSYAITFPPNEVGEWNVNASCVIGGKTIKSETMCFTVKQYRIEVGYAIIIVGRNDEWLSQNYIDLTANMTYDTLLKRGFTDERLFYLSPMNFERVDMQTSKENISYAINTWAEGKVGTEVPLFIYIIGHGKEDMLLLKGLGETLSSSELDSNLDELSADTGCYKITVVIESCSSGSFICNLSTAGRIIVTSTGAKANSLIEQTGATFSKYFFNSIAKGKNIKEAFEETSNVPEIKAYSDTLDKVGLSPQISLLDDNGDGIGHPAPVYHGDGSLSSSTYIGSQFGALDFPPTILDSIDNQTVMVGEEIEIWAVVVDDLKVERVYVTLIEPDFAIDQISNDTMYEINLTTLELKEEVGNRYMVSFVPKKEGRYTFIIHANDEEGNIAKPREVTIVATESEFDTGPETYLSIIVYNTWIPIVRLEQ